MHGAQGRIVDNRGVTAHFYNQGRRLTVSEISGRLGGERKQEEQEKEPRILAPDARGARWLRRHLAGSVTVVTAAADGEFLGATITASALVSVEPMLLLVSIEEDSQMREWLGRAGGFAFNVLPWREQFLADQFAGFTPRASTTFAGIDHSIGETGAPILAGSIAWADCLLRDSFQTGDHHCFLGEAVMVGKGGGEPEDPLIYFLNHYRRLS